MKKEHYKVTFYLCIIYKSELKKIDKKTFYSSKEAILLDSVDLSKIVVSSRWKLNDTTYKYLWIFK